MRMKRKNETPEREYEVVWLIGGSVNFSQRYEGYEPAWREFSRLSRATGTERVLKETVFRVRDRGGEWKEAARCLVGPPSRRAPDAEDRRDVRRLGRTARGGRLH